MAEKKTKKVEVKKDKTKDKKVKSKPNPILTISDNEVREYASIFSEHKLKLLEIESGSTKLTLKRADEQRTQQIASVAYQIPTNVAQVASPMQVETVAANPTSPAVATQEPQVSGNSNYLEIKSPIVGTYYSAASPDTPPYVKEGDVVSADTVVGIVEAMKMMNEIKAGINGKIVRRLVDNNTAIEENATLFLVEP